MDDCIFCKIVKEELPSHKVWEDETHLAFLDIHPINPGHTLLIPKNHIDNVFDISDDGYQELFLTAKKIAPKLQKVTGAKRIGLIVEGFAVPHAHIHLVPINNDKELKNPKGGKITTESELEEMQKIIKI